MKRPIYLDHHATTPVDPRGVEVMLPFFAEDFGNASSSTHVYGWRAEAAVGLARERIADAIGASDPSEIVFTSGTTESDNLAVSGFARANRRRGRHLAHRRCGRGEVSSVGSVGGHVADQAERRRGIPSECTLGTC